MAKYAGKQVVGKKIRSAVLKDVLSGAGVGPRTVDFLATAIEALAEKVNSQTFGRVSVIADRSLFESSFGDLGIRLTGMECGGTIVSIVPATEKELPGVTVELLAESNVWSRRHRFVFCVRGLSEEQNERLDDLEDALKNDPWKFSALSNCRDGWKPFSDCHDDSSEDLDENASCFFVFSKHEHRDRVVETMARIYGFSADSPEQSRSSLAESGYPSRSAKDSDDSNLFFGAVTDVWRCKNDFRFALFEACNRPELCGAMFVSPEAKVTKNRSSSSKVSVWNFLDVGRPVVCTSLFSFDVGNKTQLFDSYFSRVLEKVRVDDGVIVMDAEAKTENLLGVAFTCDELRIETRDSFPFRNIEEKVTGVVVDDDFDRAETEAPTFSDKTAEIARKMIAALQSGKIDSVEFPKFSLLKNGIKTHRFHATIDRWDLFWAKKKIARMMKTDGFDLDSGPFEEQVVSIWLNANSAVDAVVNGIALRKEFSSKRWRVNGFPIVREDLRRIFSDCVCLATQGSPQEVVNEHIREISRINYLIRDALAMGLEVDLPVSLESGVTAKCLIKLLTEKNRFFVDLGEGRKIRLVGSRQFISCYKNRKLDLEDFLRHFPKSTFRDFAALIACSQKFYDEAVKKSAELLGEVCEKVGARVENDHVVVSGSSGNRYRISKKDAAVYHKVGSGDWSRVCIVDSTDPGAGFDAVISRVLALANDSETKKVITTIPVT